jgi:hypothetical protein
VKGLRLSDVRESATTDPFYTHHTMTGSSRLDRIYLSPTLQRNKRRVGTIVAAVTDHLAIVMRKETSDPILRGRGFLRMNTILLRKTDFRQLQDKWKYRQTHRKNYSTALMWWDQYVKRMLR